MAERELFDLCDATGNSFVTNDKAIEIAMAMCSDGQLIHDSVRDMEVEGLVNFEGFQNILRKLGVAEPKLIETLHTMRSQARSRWLQTNGSPTKLDFTEDVTVQGLYNAAVAASGGKLRRSRLEPLVAALVPQLTQKDRRKIVNIVEEEEDGSIQLSSIRILLERCGTGRSTPVHSAQPSSAVPYYCAPDPLIQQERAILSATPGSEYASQPTMSRSPLPTNDCSGAVNQLLAENAELKRMVTNNQQDPNCVHAILSENEMLRKRLDKNDYSEPDTSLMRENMVLRRQQAAEGSNNSLLAAENDELRRQVEILSRGNAHVDADNQLAHQQNNILRQQVAQGQQSHDSVLRENEELKQQNARLREQLQEATTQISTLSAEAVYKSQARMESLNLLQQPKSEGLEERLAELEHEVAEARAGNLRNQGVYDELEHVKRSLEESQTKNISLESEVTMLQDKLSLSESRSPESHIKGGQTMKERSLQEQHLTLRNQAAYAMQPHAYEPASIYRLITAYDELVLAYDRRLSETRRKLHQHVRRVQQAETEFVRLASSVDPQRPPSPPPPVGHHTAKLPQALQQIQEAITMLATKSPRAKSPGKYPGGRSHPRSRSLDASRGFRRQGYEGL
eukprot:TRINITY_DN21958_c0_g1_i1.p1 TRINITY_DN21958_c0_g1~~TRINITY_DN21958_c0_g1_i1.p1  ORF type:complete len:624 (+),score=132.95 TRINITY_DN21958_c0_g1_i1:38-1909(+)